MYLFKLKYMYRFQKCRHVWSTNKYNILMNFFIWYIHKTYRSIDRSVSNWLLAAVWCNFYCKWWFFIFCLLLLKTMQLNIRFFFFFFKFSIYWLQYMLKLIAKVNKICEIFGCLRNYCINRWNTRTYINEIHNKIIYSHNHNNNNNTKFLKLLKLNRTEERQKKKFLNQKKKTANGVFVFSSVTRFNTCAYFRIASMSSSHFLSCGCVYFRLIKTNY